MYFITDLGNKQNNFIIIKLLLFLFKNILFIILIFLTNTFLNFFDFNNKIIKKDLFLNI